jgi:hypothetical protein
MMDSKETNWRQKMIKVTQLFIGVSFVAISACGGSNDYTDDKSCEKMDSVCSNYGTEIKFCIKIYDYKGWYKTNGQTFGCDGDYFDDDFCDSAAIELMNYCESGEKDDLASKLLFEKAKNKTLKAQSKTLKIQLDQAHEDILK